MSDSIECLIAKTEERLGIPDGLLWSCAWVESRHNPNARRYEPHLDDESLGLMQMLVGTARDESWLRPMRLEPISTREALLDPETNLTYGGAYLRHQYNRFPEIVGGKDWPTERWKFAVLAYNAGRGHVNAALAAARKHLRLTMSARGEYLWRELWFSAAFLGVHTKQSAENAQSARYHVAKVWSAWWEYKRERGLESA